MAEEKAGAIIGRKVRRLRDGGLWTREELAAKEEAEIAILREYLPEPLTERELQALVDDAVAATGASSPRDLGKVMGRLSPATRGRADGRRLSELVAATLTRRDLAAHDGAGH